MTHALTFLGQQSWLIETGGARILVDPVLTPSFGNSPNIRFEIHPARDLDPDRLPSLDAVVVTNEHLDHFHLPSLCALPPHVPVLLLDLTPAVCVEALRSTGREVRLLRHAEPVVVGGAELRLLQGDPGVPVWESRVASVYVGEAGAPAGGVLVQSDTALGAPAQYRELRPAVLVATHNAQVPPAGRLGAFDNLLPVPPAAPPETTGLDLLHELLNTSLDVLPDVRHVLLSGGGYTQIPPKHGAFLWNDAHELAAIAGELALGTTLVGLHPGQRAVLDGTGVRQDRVPWITPRPSTLPVAPADHTARADTEPAEELEPLFPTPPDAAGHALIERELALLAPLVLLSPLGRALVGTNEYLGAPVGEHRFAVHLRGHHDADRAYALNVNTARFEPVEPGLRALLFTVPAGIDVHASDLLAVLTGRIQIWELAVSRMRQWYLGDLLDSPVSLLYGCLSEQLRPDLAARYYRAAIEAA